jgi:hypothetical protein
MNARQWAAARFVVLAATTHCAMAARGSPSDPESAPEDEVPLELSVSSADIVHGGLRVTATMQEGSADLAIVLGSDCEHREVGGGITTASAFTWILGPDDLAAALRCNLLAIAHTRDATGRHMKTASLPVDAEVVSLEEDGVSDTRDVSGLVAEMADEEIASSFLSGRPMRVSGASLGVTICIAGIAPEQSTEDEAKLEPTMDP